jgi:hypothetical protein
MKVIRGEPTLIRKESIAALRAGSRLVRFSRTENTRRCGKNGLYWETYRHREEKLAYVAGESQLPHRAYLPDGTKLVATWRRIGHCASIFDQTEEAEAPKAAVSQQIEGQQAHTRAWGRADFHYPPKHFD